MCERERERQTDRQRQTERERVEVTGFIIAVTGPVRWKPEAFPDGNRYSPGSQSLIVCLPQRSLCRDVYAAVADSTRILCPASRFAPQRTPSLKFSSENQHQLHS